MQKEKACLDEPAVPGFIIFTDLDGSLLDPDTYAWEPATPALALCKNLHIVVVIVSSKTRAEMEHLRRSLPVFGPFISENGGGIFFPSNSFDKPPACVVFDKGLWRCSCGLPYDDLVRGLKEIREELGWNIKGFFDMNIEEISRLTGLDEHTSHLAAMREYDEPFIVLETQPVDKNALFKAAKQRGLTVTKGGRFYHLKGKTDKGLAVEKVLSWYRTRHKEVVSIGLGDSPNDFPMLDRVTHPVLIRSKKDYPSLKKRIPRLRVTRDTGPLGWNSAVLEILGKKQEGGNA